MKKLIARMAVIATMVPYSWAHVHKSIENKLTLSAGNDYQRVMKTLQSKGIDVLGVDIRNSLIDVNVSDSELELIKSLKVEFTYQMEKKAALDERYLNPAEVESFLKKINRDYPEITKLEKVGESLQGNAIWAIKISDNANIKEVGEPAVLYNGMHHSREIMTPEVTTDIVSYLTKNYNKDSKVKKWVDNNEIWVLPMFNVDGNLKVWQGSKMWRKNTRGGYGVDINRNYPTNWNACNGSSGWRNSQTYRGSAAASEPETKVMMDFVSRIKPVFNISYHAYSELIIYPYGCKGQRTANREVVEGIGKKIGEILDYVPGTSWETLYSVDGSDIDWMYQEEQVIPYVIEVSPRSDGFQPDYSKRDPTVKHNRAGWQYLLDRMEQSGIHGISKNYKTIRVEKFENDTLKEIQNYRVNPDGSYHIILNDGKYKVTFIGNENVERIIELTGTKLQL
jgi:hypothetical protein